MTKPRRWRRFRETKGYRTRSTWRRARRSRGSDSLQGVTCIRYIRGTRWVPSRAPYLGLDQLWGVNPGISRHVCISCIWGVSRRKATPSENLIGGGLFRGRQDGVVEGVDRYTQREDLGCQRAMSLELMALSLGSILAMVGCWGCWQRAVQGQGRLCARSCEAMMTIIWGYSGWSGGVAAEKVSRFVEKVGWH